MAERDKEWMDGEVQGALKGYKVNWQTRQGAPYAAGDLAKVGSKQQDADAMFSLRLVLSGHQSRWQPTAAQLA